MKYRLRSRNRSHSRSSYSSHFLRPMLLNRLPKPGGLASRWYSNFGIRTRSSHSNSFYNTFISYLLCTGLESQPVLYHMREMSKCDKLEKCHSPANREKNRLKRRTAAANSTSRLETWLFWAICICIQFCCGTHTCCSERI